MGIRILHTADIHIGLKFSGRDYPFELKEKLVAEPLNTLRRMVDLANSQNCDLMVIAGDMFDRINTPKNEVRKAAEILNSFNGQTVAVLPGNHDQGGEQDFQDKERDFQDKKDDQDSIWKVFRERMNEHLLVFLNRKVPVEVKINEADVVFYPGPCRTKHSAENMISWVKDIEKNKDSIHIGVAHGSVEGLSPDMEQNYFPMRIGELRESGVDFWLLGHTHVRYPDKGGNINPLFFMPSTPCPDGFDCLHEGFAWIIDFNEDRSIRYESVKTGHFLFKTWEREVHSINDLMKIKEDVSKLDKDRVLMKLKLTGRLNRNELDQIPVFKEEIAGMLAYAEIDSDEVTLNIDQEYIEKTFTKGSLPYRLLASLASGENQLALQLAHDLIGESKT